MGRDDELRSHLRDLQRHFSGGDKNGQEDEIDTEILQNQKKEKNRKRKDKKNKEEEVKKLGEEDSPTVTDKEKKKKKRVVRERDVEQLNFEAESLKVKAGISEVQEVKAENNKNEKLVWYPGILDDLRMATYLDDQLDDKEKDQQSIAASRLRNRGIKVPPMSTSIKDNEGNFNRQKLRSATEYLVSRDVSGHARKLWETRDEAIDYLKSIGIGDHEGILSRENDELIVEVRSTKEPPELNLQTKYDFLIKSYGDVKPPMSLDERRKQKKEEKEAKDKKLVWYEGIVDDLIKATDLPPELKKNASEDDKKSFENKKETFKQQKESALINLRKRIPSIDEKLKNDRGQIYWAIGILNGGKIYDENGKQINPWTDKDKALDYLRTELKIDKDGKDPLDIKNGVESEAEMYQRRWQSTGVNVPKEVTEDDLEKLGKGRVENSGEMEEEKIVDWTQDELIKSLSKKISEEKYQAWLQLVKTINEMTDPVKRERWILLLRSSSRLLENIDLRKKEGTSWRLSEKLLDSLGVDTKMV